VVSSGSDSGISDSDGSGSDGSGSDGDVDNELVVVVSVDDGFEGSCAPACGVATTPITVAPTNNTVATATAYLVRPMG